MRNLDLNDAAVLDHSLVVSASAGSGKTFTLSVLVTAHLGREAVRPFEILATTFGEAAASDLRERLLRPLDLLAILDAEAWRELLPLLGMPGGREVEALLKALPLPEALRKSASEVGQASALWAGAAWAAGPARARAFWRRIRREAELLQVSTIHSLALGLLKQGEGAPEAILDPAHPALLRLLRQTVRETLAPPANPADEPAARALLAWAERNWQALSAGHDGHRDAMGHLEPEDPAPFRDAVAAGLARAETAFRELADHPERAVDPANKYKHNFKPSNLKRVPGAGADLGRRLRWAQKQSLVLRDPEDVPQYYSETFREAYASLAPVADAWEAWQRCLLVEALRAFEGKKLEHSQATFGDLVRKALQGLEDTSLEPPRPKLLLVDECQDTSRSQDAFLGALGAERTVRVGDLKQAIYGFRGGDPDLLRNHLEEAGEWAFRLPANFRSAPPVVALANRYVGEVWPLLDPGAATLDGQQEATGEGALPVGLVRSPGPSHGTDLPGLVDWIAALSGEEGWDRTLGTSARPGPRRRALLVRQRTKLPTLIRMLKARGIQPYVVSREGFWDSPGVRLVMAVFEAVAHPERALPCATLLRNLAGFTDGELTALAASREGRPGLGGLGALEAAAVPEARREAVAWICALRGASTQELAGRLLVQGALLARVGALRIHGAMEAVRARRNLAALLSRILELPASAVAAFALLDEERAGQEKGDLPAPAEGADLLIQTVHGSKGLEYDDVILPMLNTRASSVRHGELRTDPASRSLALLWKLGSHPGLAYRTLKPLEEARQKRDDLNLLYVAFTRARERMCLVLQEPPGDPKKMDEARNWVQWGHHLAKAHPELLGLEAPPAVEHPPAAPGPVLTPPGARTALGEILPGTDGHDALPPGVRARARQEGEAMHGYLQDLLVRWEDAEAFRIRLADPPPVPQAREHALAFLERFEARGWRHRRRRTELPIAGAARSGAGGRADLVVWDGDRIHLLDFKNSRSFGEADRVAYAAQLDRYGAALRAREGLPVEAWLIPLKGGDWIPVALKNEG